MWLCCNISMLMLYLYLPLVPLNFYHVFILTLLMCLWIISSEIIVDYIYNSHDHFGSSMHDLYTVFSPYLPPSVIDRL